MIGKDAAERRWSIGELAQASGVSVRALRHYDGIGLLRASGRTASGHRRYTEQDLRRLYRVLTSGLWGSRWSRSRAPSTPRPRTWRGCAAC
ncbi:MerR family transcriptional regulator [Streptomyces sp. NPDC026659]|uniref:MerR family transcriptional regulator n=1 Tax=Streptomyces sp. NPDC026659 TaxID=3155123 RepID=UPI0033E054DA